MNTQYLKYAVEVERTGSFTKAAQNLYMSQPRLSKAIRELEAQLGTELFNRTAKGVQPTPKGEIFLARARNILTIPWLRTCTRQTSVRSLHCHTVRPVCSYRGLS